MEEDAGLDAFNEAMTSAPVEKPKRPGHAWASGGKAADNELWIRRPGRSRQIP
jgi:hypothetical protein